MSTGEPETGFFLAPPAKIIQSKSFAHVKTDIELTTLGAVTRATVWPYFSTLKANMCTLNLDIKLQELPDSIMIEYLVTN